MTGTMKTAAELSFEYIILIGGFAAMIVIVLLIFAKRQIMRFALKSSRGPHTSIGKGLSKVQQNTVERKIQRIISIKHEPNLLQKDDYRIDKYIGGDVTADEKCTYIYRMMAVDKFKQFDKEMEELHPGLARGPCEEIRRYLEGLSKEVLKGAGSSLIAAFADSYEHARFGYKPFGEKEYNDYVAMFNEMIKCIRDKTYRAKKTKETVKRHSVGSARSIVSVPETTKHSRLKKQSSITEEAIRFEESVLKRISSEHSSDTDKNRTGVSQTSLHKSEELQPLMDVKSKRKGSHTSSQVNNEEYSV
ncbi:protein C1orf43 homolog isoform X2 [Antedon mediterranea]|uniref:protein C1orf43 homolog isoform X2 n=1 Tax=Antedon mediterranea TaxID=105859 RepID=UPI003AF9EDC3